MLLISANESLILRRMEQPREPGYYCNKKRYLLKEVEAAREAACRGFVSTREDARRPIIHTKGDDVENLMFEWSLPPSKVRNAKAEGRNYKGSIVLNNSCELKGVIYYDHKSKKNHPCHKVPEVSISTTSGKEQLSKKPAVQCGSLSWEIEEIQQLAVCDLYNSQHELVEVKYTSDQVDGPWKKISMIKIVRISNRPHEVQFDIIVNNKDEVRGIAVKHHIWWYQTMAENFNKDNIYLSVQEKRPKTLTIDLVCPYDNTFPLYPPKMMPIVSSSRKRKTLA